MNLSVEFSDDSWIQGGGCHRLPLGPHRPIGNPSNNFNPPSSPTTPSKTLTLSSTSSSALTLCLQRPLILYFNINPSPHCLQRPWKLLPTTNISALPQRYSMRILVNQSDCCHTPSPDGVVVCKSLDSVVSSFGHQPPPIVFPTPPTYSRSQEKHCVKDRICKEIWSEKKANRLHNHQKFQLGRR